MLAAFGIPILMMVASQKHQCNGIRLCILYTITINIYIYMYGKQGWECESHREAPLECHG